MLAFMFKAMPWDQQTIQSITNTLFKKCIYPAAPEEVLPKTWRLDIDYTLPPDPPAKNS